MNITAPISEVSTASLFLNQSLKGKDIEFRVNVNGKIKKFTFDVVDHDSGVMFIAIPSLIAGVYPYKVYDVNARKTIDSGDIEISSGSTSSLELGVLSTNAYYGDKGKTAYDHSQTAHAPSNAQANNISDVNATALTGGGETALHYHVGGGLTQAQILTRQL